MRAAATEAGRDPGPLEYARWESIDMTSEDVQAHVGNGVTRLVIPVSADMREQISAFAGRHNLS